MIGKVEAFDCFNFCHTSLAGMVSQNVVESAVRSGITCWVLLVWICYCEIKFGS